MKIGIITGASSGLGKEFAKQIEAFKECDELWLVARREERLNALAETLMTKCRVFPFDLTDPKNIDDLAAAVKTSGATVAYLVNAAGFGKFGDYSEVSRENIRGMIDLNARAVADVTAALIPYTKRGSHIIEVASISAYLPLENLSVYAATKAFVLSYSYALRAELKKKGVTVTAVAPGWIDTEFAAVAHNGEGVNGPRDLKPITTPDKVVKKALRAALKNKPVSILGGTWKAMHVMSKILPRRFSMAFWHMLQKRK